MTSLIEILIMVSVLANFRLLGSSRVSACIQTAAGQALLLSLLPVLMHFGDITIGTGAFIAIVVVVKTVVLPKLLTKAAHKVGLQREVEPLLGYTHSIIAGAILLGICFIVGRNLPLNIPGADLLIPGAMFTMLTGLLLVVSRRKALTQVIGYLVTENGIYAFGAALAVQEPILVEMGVLLDLLVAIFVMGIAIHHISREFDHIDTDRLTMLKD